MNILLGIRNILRDRVAGAINILGLAIAFACTFIVIIWIKYELSYDRFLPNAGRIYRLTFETENSGNRLHFARCPQSWVSQIPSDFPQIEQMVRIEPFRHTALKAGENKFYSDRVFAADSGFFSVFGIEPVSGNPDDILSEPYSAVIASSVAAKLFGDVHPVGKTISLSGEYDTRMIPYTITGIMKDNPANSHIHFDVVTSYSNPGAAPSWAYVYILLRQNTGPEEILSGLPAFIDKVRSNTDQNVYTPHLQKITDIHLYSRKDRELEPNGNISSLYLFAITALVLLLISWTNYINLSNAGMPIIHKQVTIQTHMGGGKKEIILQLISQSVIVVLASFLLSLILADTFRQLFSSFAGVSFLPEGSGGLFTIWPSITVVIVISLIAGTLPSAISFLKSGKTRVLFSNGIQGTVLNKTSYGILMTLQFLLAFILLVSAITIYRQKDYIFSGSMGKMSTEVLVFKKQNWEIRAKYNAFRARALQDPFIKNFTASMEEPTGETVDALQVESSALDEAHRDKPLYVLSVEDNFLDFFSIPLVAGRTFSPFDPDRKGEDYILNESAVKHLGWSPQEAIGRPLRIRFSVPDIFYGGTVVGVVSDFCFTSVKQEIKPYVLFQKPIFYLCFMVEVDPDHRQEAIAHMKKIWEQELPDYPFQFESLNDIYRTSYKKELVQARLTSVFAIIAIIIICFGLYSVTSVLVSRRTKEIGIRKVNGASIPDILLMLYSDFIKWLVVAFIAACPAAWYIMDKWLQNFVYRTELNWWVFAGAGMTILIVTVATLYIQTWRAAAKNPVEALRYE